MPGELKKSGSHVPLFNNPVILLLQPFQKNAYLLLFDRLSDIEAFDLVFVAFLAYFDLDLHVPGVFVGHSLCLLLLYPAFGKGIP